MTEKKPLSNLLRWTYGFVDLTDTLHNNTGNILFTFVLTNVLMFSLESNLLINSVASTIVVFVPFFVGIITSGTPAMKWGRYRSWLLIAAPVANIAFVLKFVRLSTNETAAAWIIIVAYIINAFGNSLCYNANGALMNVIASNSDERAVLSRNRGFHTALAGVLYSYTGTPLALALAAVFGMAGGYAGMVICVAVVNCLSMWYTVWITRGYEGPGTADLATQKRAPLSVMLKSLVQNRSLIGLVITDILRFSSNMTIMGTQTYFFTYVMQDTGLMATYIFWGGILQTVGSYASGSIVKKFSAKSMLTASEFVIAGALALSFFASANGVLVFILLMVYRFAHGFSYSIFFNSYADCVVYGEWKTGMSIPGFTISLTSVAAQMGSMVKGWLLPLILIAISFDATVPVAECAPSVISGIGAAFCLIPAGIRFAGAVILLLVYNLTNEKIRQCEEELSARKGG